ncbi:aquaporin-8-like [Saccostrea cucullata]|uniref:aquaporin-8-like n=1 Tax=Saccostrea cuccullata TaxID=36930 RepID=UPI002ED41911
MSELDPLINRGAADSFYDRVVRPSLAEFFGTIVFVFVGCMAVQTQVVAPIAIAHGLTIVVLIAGLGKISGGHFNPVVTLGVTLSGGMHWVASIFYVLAQLLGGMFWCIFQAVLPETVYKEITGGAHTLGSGVYAGWAVLAEGILTFLLVFTVLLTAVDENKTKLAPLAIGFSVVVDIIAGAKTTGASMNPARSFGPAVAYSKYGDVNVWEHHYVYWFGPICGAGVAALLYKMLFATGNRRLYIER